MGTAIHHVTGITRNVQKNINFYAGFLGLQLVKQSGGFTQDQQVYLFYGDQSGTPGSLLTFLSWREGAEVDASHHQVSEIALAVPPCSIAEWLQRAVDTGLPVQGPNRETGEIVLRLRDPDGIVVRLIEADLPVVAPLPDPIAPTRILGVKIPNERAPLLSVSPLVCGCANGRTKLN